MAGIKNFEDFRKEQQKPQSKSFPTFSEFRIDNHKKEISDFVSKTNIQSPLDTMMNIKNGKMPEHLKPMATDSNVSVNSNTSSNYNDDLLDRMEDGNIAQKILAPVGRGIEWIQDKVGLSDGVIGRTAHSAVSSVMPTTDLKGNPGMKVKMQEWQPRGSENETINKIADVTGHMGGYLFNPSGGGGPTAVYKGMGSLLATKAGSRAEQAISNAGQKVAQKLNPLLNTQGIHMSEKLAGKMAQESVKEAITGAAYAAPYSLLQGEDSTAQIAKNMAMDGVMGAIAGPLVGAVGHGIGNMATKIQDKKAFKDAIDEFLKKPDLVGEEALYKAGSSPAREMQMPSQPEITSSGNDLAANYRRSEGYQQQLTQAIEDQYQYLKESVTNRRSADKAGIIKDDLTGNVVGRYGSVSNNPPWLQEFYSQNRRMPTDKDLRILADQHVKKGFQTETGKMPAWKPNELQEIENELNGIRESMSQVDNVTKAELETAVMTLEGEKNKLGKLLPDGIQAMQKRSDTVIPDNVQTYSGNHIPFRNAADQSERTISRIQVVENIKKNLGVIIDSGHMATKDKAVLGQFHTQNKVVRTKMAEDLQTISHEVGHFLDNKYKLKDQLHQVELNNLLKEVGEVDIAAYHPSQLHDEGIAEYFRLYFTDPERAMLLAPEFSRHIVKSLPSKIKKGLQATQKDMDTWITQGDFNQAVGLIDFDGGAPKKKFNKNEWYTRSFDELNPLLIAEKALKGSVGVGKDSIYKMARLSRGVNERAKMAVTRGIIDSNGNKVSDGLTEIVKPLQELGITEKEFATYLAVKHAVDLKKMGKRVPFDDNHIVSVFNRLDKIPEVLHAQQKIIKYNNSLLDLLVDAEIYTAKSVEEMKKKYPNYVPFFRALNDDGVAGYKKGSNGISSGFANLTNPLKRMSEEGSTKSIINSFEGMINNTFLIMNAAAKNKVGLQLADLAKIEGAGAWVEHLGTGGRDLQDHIISVSIDGEKNQFKIRDPELYNAMLSLDNESTNSLIKFLGGMAGVLRAGATLTPEFMIRNAFRDVVGATINSTKYGFNPIDFFKGLGHVIGKTDTFDKFINSGGAMGTMMSLDRDANREALKEVFKNSLKDKTLNVITSPKELAKLISLYTPLKSTVNVLRKGAEISEFATKVGSFNKTLKKTGSLEEAAYTSRDLMDFNRAGSATRQWNKATAFLNASLQGTDKMVRSFKDNPASFVTRAFTSLVLPSIGLYYWVNSLPEDQKKVYDNIPQWQKDSFFIVPGPDGEFFRIPKPFEVGMLFSTGTERSLRWLNENDPEAFKRYGSTVAESLTPPVLFTALTPLLEAITNHSFFRKAPIVPQAEQRFEKKDQYGTYTSEVSKGLGQAAAALGLGETNAASPRIIDNTLKGYTAGLGQYAISGIDALINAGKGGRDIPLPEKKWSEQPLVKAFTVNTAGGGQVREDFYDKWDKLSKKKASADRNDEEFNDPDYGALKSAKKQIDEMMKQYKGARDSATMTPEEKRKRLDQLDAAMNEMAARGLRK